ncbi:MAG: metallophosphoesterase [Opitutales bacterium]|nr:metallophosphoesterase [Opitutales bacterium]
MENAQLNSEARLLTDRCLLIFDIHQNIRWLQRILQRELDQVSQVVLGGDYFDPYSAEADTAGRTAETLLSLRGQLGDRLTVLLGNHDIQYLEALPWLGLHEDPADFLRYSVGSEFRVDRAGEITTLH